MGADQFGAAAVQRPGNAGAGGQDLETPPLDNDCRDRCAVRLDQIDAAGKNGSLAADAENKLGATGDLRLEIGAVGADDLAAARQ